MDVFQEVKKTLGGGRVLTTTWLGAVRSPVEVFLASWMTRCSWLSKTSLWSGSCVWSEGEDAHRPMTSLNLVTAGSKSSSTVKGLLANALIVSAS